MSRYKDWIWFILVSMTLSIIIPIFNEENTIQQLLKRIVAVRLINEIQKEIIIIDDCSRDNSESLIRDYIPIHPEVNIVYIKHKMNKGKGAALKTGIEKASGDFIIMQDADLEYDPNEYNTLLQPIIDGFADVVYGSRFSGGNAHRILFFWHALGNRLLTFISNAFTNLNLTDMETCYKIFKSSIIKNILIEEQRFGFEPEITSKLSRLAGIKIYEVGISYYGRSYSEGKKIKWKDGFYAIYCIFKYNLMRR